MTSNENKRVMECIPEEFAANMFPDVAQAGETFEPLDVTSQLFGYKKADIVQDEPAPDGWKLEDETQQEGALQTRIAVNVGCACQQLGKAIEQAGAKVCKFLIRDHARTKFAVSVLISVDIRGKRFANYLDVVVVSTFAKEVETWLEDKGVRLGEYHV